jgi:hypothetical protein
VLEEQVQLRQLCSYNSSSAFPTMSVMRRAEAPGLRQGIGTSITLQSRGTYIRIESHDTYLVTSCAVGYQSCLCGFQNNPNLCSLFSDAFVGPKIGYLGLKFMPAPENHCRSPFIPSTDHYSKDRQARATRRAKYRKLHNLVDCLSL